jgi:UDP-N-acetylglucosamine--N-acetylmuramyl-(pentapeptide) pyrophosphoryl-undecaprenol N-acetylglucosamine transferase
MAYVQHEAAILLPDQKAIGELWKTIKPILEHEEVSVKLGSKIRQLAKPEATEEIIKVLEEVIK